MFLFELIGKKQKKRKATTIKVSESQQEFHGIQRKLFKLKRNLKNFVDTIFMEANRNDANSSNNSPTAATNKNTTFLIDKTNSKTIEAKKISNNSANVAATTTVTTTKNTTILVNTTKSKTYQHHNHHNHHHPHQNQQSSNTSKTEKNRIKSTKMTATQVVQPYFHVQDNQLYQEPTCYYKTYDQLLAERGYRLGRTLGCGSYAKVKYVSE